MPPEDAASWAEACDDLAAMYAEEMEDLGYPGWEIVQRYIELCEDAGYVWPREWAVR